MYKKLSILLGLSVLSSVSVLASAQNLYMNDLKLKADLDWLNTQTPISFRLPKNFVKLTKPC